MSGSFEVALREATLEINTAGTAIEWTWAPEWHALAIELKAGTEVVSFSGSELASLTRTDGGTLKADGRAKFGITVLGGETGGSVELTDKQDARRDSGQASTWTYTRNHPYLVVSRGPTSFSMSFSSGPADDLTEINGHLGRRPLLDQDPTEGKCPDEGEIVYSPVDLKSLNIVMSLPIDPTPGDTRHAFNIRRATGAWSPFRDQTNRRVFAEILLSKFLAPAHDPLTVWPIPESKIER